MQRILIAILCAAPLLLQGGCAIQKLNIQQGNVVDEAMLKQIQPGMTKRQVRFVLGTPLLNDPFHPQRWDYIYLERVRNQVRGKRHLTLYFTDDTLARVEKVPADKQAWTSPVVVPPDRD